MGDGAVYDVVRKGLGGGEVRGGFGREGKGDLPGASGVPADADDEIFLGVEIDGEAVA